MKQPLAVFESGVLTLSALRFDSGLATAYRKEQARLAIPAGDLQHVRAPALVRRFGTLRRQVLPALDQ